MKKKRFPDLQDCGKTVSMQYDDKLIKGVLFIEEWYFNGEGEYPVWVIECEDGTEYSVINECVFEE